MFGDQRPGLWSLSPNPTNMEGEPQWHWVAANEAFVYCADKKKKSKDVTILLPIHLLAILKLAINAKTSKWH